MQYKNIKNNYILHPMYEMVQIVFKHHFLG